MTIEPTNQGFLCYEIVGVGIHARLHKKHYMGFSKHEVIRQFSAELARFNDKGEIENDG